MTSRGEMMNNNEYDKLSTDNGLMSFYSGTSVFVTGGTGFVGKAIVEKLLRACEDINFIYILMRSKKGAGIEQRFKELIDSLIFENIRNKKPELLEKIKPIDGDISMPGLGIHAEDEQILIDNVNIIIHSAATVKFSEPLHMALTQNTMGTKSIIELAQRVKSLKSLVYVSTAYSNADRQETIDEVVYPSRHDPEAIIECCKILPPETINSMWSTLKGNHPNTYTFTKNLSETLVKRYFKKLPVTIVRPSIVTAACNEPMPGWVENLGGSTGPMLEIYMGTMRTSILNHMQSVMNYIPVDYVVNTCVSAAWHHTTFKSDDIVVYNCTAGRLNPMLWTESCGTAAVYGRKMPTKHVLLYPQFCFTSSNILNTFWEFVTELAPCFILDWILRLQNKRAILVKSKRRGHAQLHGSGFVLTRDWDFKVDNMKSLLNAVKVYGEDAYFPLDLNAIDLKKYLDAYMKGIRRFILKDNIESLPQAFAKLRKLYIIQQSIRFFIAACVIKCIIMLIRLKY